MEKYSWIGRFSIVKMSVLLNLTCRFNAVSTQILESYFVSINKLVLKFMWRSKRPRLVNTILKEKNKVGGLIPCDYKIYYKAMVPKTL